MPIPLTEKYRPKTLDEIAGNTEVINCLKSFKISNMPNMLFYGPPGTGKTTAIKAMLCNHPFQNILELNASDERGIDTVREKIKGFATTKSADIKVIILDEVDSMSKDAQGALRRIMEDFPNTRFCLICNYVRKIIEPLVSRCTKLRFSPVRKSGRAEEICLKEGILYDEEGLELINECSDGDMRKIVNDIQGMSGAYKKIDKKSVLEFFGLSDDKIYVEMFELLIKSTFDNCKKYIYDNEIDSMGLINNLSKLLIKSELKNKFEIFNALAEIEHRLGNGCSEGVQTNAIIAAFIINRT